MLYRLNCVVDKLKTQNFEQFVPKITTVTGKKNPKFDFIYKEKNPTLFSQKTKPSHYFTHNVYAFFNNSLRCHVL